MQPHLMYLARAGVILNVSRFEFFFLKMRFSLSLGSLTVMGRALPPKESNRLKWFQGFNPLVN